MTETDVRRTLLRGGVVRTPADPHATALLIEGENVVWVGSDETAEAHDADVVVDLEGALVTPAFVDAHVHATSAGLGLTGLDLSGAASLAEALRMVAAHANSGAVLLGQCWDETRWPEQRPPTRPELDEAAGGAKVYLSRVDVHSAVVSTALLDDVPKQTDGWADSGHLSRDAHHVARRTAFASITPAQRREAQRRLLDYATSLGIGALHECGGPEIAGEDDFTGLLDLAHDVSGPYVFGYWGEHLAVEKARELGAVGVGGDLFVDGAVGSHTAALEDPYADAPTDGHVYLDGSQLGRHIAACVQAGVQPGFHAIGDRALRSILIDGIAEALKDVSGAELRAAGMRVEHAELLDSELIAAMARYGVIASVQPAFDAAWGGPDGMYVRRLGPARAKAMNPFAALAKAGVPLAFGSDAPVTPLDPWGTIRAAADHRTPEQGITARAAFDAHTRGGWRALGVKSDESGVLAPGERATYAVWSAGELVDGLPSGTPSCLATVVRGRVVHSTGVIMDAGRQE